MEVYFRVLKANGSKAAKEVINSFARYVIDFDLPGIQWAMKLRLELMNDKCLDISYSDAVGYYLADRLR